MEGIGVVLLLLLSVLFVVVGKDEVEGGEGGGFSCREGVEDPDEAETEGEAETSAFSSSTRRDEVDDEA